MSASDYVVGVDGGNTKTIALVSTLSGAVIGCGRAGPSDVYGVAAHDAFQAIETAVRAALSEAGKDGLAPLSSAFCLAGADWPEDFDLYRAELDRRFAWTPAPHVLNDALAGVWTGATPGTGVSIACGTWNAIGARSEEGREWHSSFWTEPSGAVGIAEDAFTAMVRSELGIADATALTAELLKEYGATDPAELLRRLTRREGRAPAQERARAAAVVLRAADEGDVAALAIVRRHAEILGNYAAAAARRVGLAGRLFHLTLTGGLFRHPTAILFDAIVERVRLHEPGAIPLRASLPPAAGAVQVALGDAGVSIDEETTAALRSTVLALELDR
jgi:N-acetylglucosamine kinase-like BadF-type ATPase